MFTITLAMLIMISIVVSVAFILNMLREDQEQGNLYLETMKRLEDFETIDKE